MVAKTKESSNALSPISQLAGWARQGIESFAAAQSFCLISPRGRMRWSWEWYGSA